MAESDVTLIGNAGQMFGDGFNFFASNYAWVLWLFVGLAVTIFVGVLIRFIVMKKKQWTHNLVYQRVLENNLLSKPFTIRMRRFPLIKRAEVFELEKPLLGGYLMPELDSYTGHNEFSIIIDKNNRIYTNKGSYFNPDNSSALVSAKHAEIDIARSDLRADYQNINKVNKRIEWTQIAKYAMWGLLIIAVMIVSITAISEWGEAQDARAASDAAFAQAMANLAEALETSQATVNGLNILADEIKEIKGTNNIQGLVKEVNNATL